ncbi:hypothetical protein SARC_17308, partial [Sphaeroforma arctica JP610]
HTIAVRRRHPTGHCWTRYGRQSLHKKISRRTAEYGNGTVAVTEPDGAAAEDASGERV